MFYSFFANMKKVNFKVQTENATAWLNFVLPLLIYRSYKDIFIGTPCRYDIKDVLFENT